MISIKSCWPIKCGTKRGSINVFHSFKVKVLYNILKIRQKTSLLLETRLCIVYNIFEEEVDTSYWSVEMYNMILDRKTSWINHISRINVLLHYYMYTIIILLTNVHITCMHFAPCRFSHIIAHNRNQWEFPDINVVAHCSIIVVGNHYYSPVYCQLQK